MRLKQGSDILLKFAGYFFVILVTVFCLIPFIMIISASFTDESAIFRYGYRLIPAKFSLEAYNLVFKAPRGIFNAYMVTITITVAGSLVSLFTTAMTAYVLLKKDFRYRNSLAFLFYFTSIFSGGLIPMYIMVVRYLQLKNTLWAVILTPMLNAWFIILMRNFMKSVPDSIAESAKIDGANEFIIFLKLYLPISKPGLATVGLFIALNYWNNWWLPMLFIEKRKMFPLQFLLYDILNSAKFAEIAAQQSGIPLPDLPQESLKMAMVVITTGPIIFLYPYVQKYFIKGLTIGAVKG